MNPSYQVNGAVSEQQIKEAPDSDYMNEVQLKFFRHRLVELRHSISERLREAKKEIIKLPDSGDESDHASWEAQCSLSLRIIDRDCQTFNRH